MTLLTELRIHGADAELRGYSVVLKAAPPELVEEARTRKDELIQELRAEFREKFNKAPWHERMQGVCLGLEPILRAKTSETGDQADRAFKLVRSFRLALAEHPRHGDNWWTRYRVELTQLLHVVLSDWFQEVEIEGDALDSATRRILDPMIRRAAPRQSAESQPSAATVLPTQEVMDLG